MNGFNLLKHIRKKDENVVVWIFNIGVEQRWNDFKQVLSDPNENIVVNHIEEINLLITCKQDYLILRRMPDRSFLDMLMQNGYEIPHIICPQQEDESKSISQLVLEDCALLEKLREIGQNGNVYFVPYGVSHDEELIAQKCGIPIIGGTTEKSITVNNKIFSKQIANSMGLPAAEGIVCHTAEEIRKAYAVLSEKYGKVVIKMPCNSSGQGIWIIDNEKKIRPITLIVERLMRTQGINEWLVEGWLEKKFDLNIQVYVSETGETETFSIKEQLIDQTLYVGSIMPPRISNIQLEQCRKYGEMIGDYLYSKGFTGIFGIDALITSDDIVVPIIEINGRFTLSTYISFVSEKYPNRSIYAFFERFRAADNFNCRELSEQMCKGGVLFENDTGAFVYNSAALDGKTADGNVRVFCMVIANDYSETVSIKESFMKIIEKNRK